MASTTLNTFILPPPPFSVRAVEIKGSWDNFSQSYQLSKDGQTGHWRGCHAFENIVCDGLSMDTSSSRDGGLKMGGTYWYFYILHTIDGDLEYHNSIEPSTDACPLLPGQHVNILDVPVQTDLILGRNVSSSSLDSMVFTLDPKDKYLPPGVRRASTTSAIKNRKARTSPKVKIIPRSPSTPLRIDFPPKTSTLSCVSQSTLHRQRSTMSIFHDLRRIRSEGSNIKSMLAWPRRLLSRTGCPIMDKGEDHVLKVPEVPKQFVKLSTCQAASADSNVESPTQRPLSGQNLAAELTRPTDIPERSIVVSWPQNGIPIGDYLPYQSPLPDSVQTSDVTLSSNSAAPAAQVGLVPPDALSTSVCDQLPEQQGKNTDPKPSKNFVGLTIAVNERAQERLHRFDLDCENQTKEILPENEDKLFARTHSRYGSSRYSCVSSENFSPGFTSNTTHSGPISPLHLSQPETPVMGDFEDGYEQDFAPLQRQSHPSVDCRLEAANFTDITTPAPPSRAPPLPPARPPPQGATSSNQYSSAGGFGGYGLPQDEHSSASTLRKPPSTTLKKPSQGPRFGSPAGNHDLVRSWNDGSEHLLDDLDYLGKLII